MDTIFIDGLQLKIIIGVYAWEQRVPRPVRVSLELDCDVREAAASDHIRDAVNYKAVCDRIEALVAERNFQLIEALAEAIARRVMEEFPVRALRVRVDKPGAVPAAANIGVRIERRREDYAVCGR
jgi:dihydroneopterin aldolase